MPSAGSQLFPDASVSSAMRLGMTRLKATRFVAMIAGYQDWRTLRISIPSMIKAVWYFV